MTPREIFAAAQDAASKDAPTTADQALIAMRKLLVSFVDATDKGCPESMKSMSIDQLRLLNQLSMAVGL